jgi:excisionase family DNA binding protein
MPIFPKLLTTREAAEILNVNPGTLRVWRHHKRYPLPYVKIGVAVRYRAEDLQEFMKKGLHQQ